MREHQGFSLNLSTLTMESREHYTSIVLFFIILYVFH